jgi:lipopolysaccharide transport system ATP-binding protein
VLFVSHNMAAILALCDRAIMLSSGRIAATGTAEAVVASYLAQREARTSLRERIDRTGNGVARIVELALLDASGAAAESVRADEPVVFEMIVEAGSAEVGKPISVVLVVSDRNENRVFSLYTDWVAPDMKLNSTRTRFSCTVAGGVMLAPDGYSVTAGILVNGVVADKMANALDFEVVSSNVFGAGAIPSSGLGACLVRHNWKSEA